MPQLSWPRLHACVQLDELVHRHIGALATAQQREKGALSHFEVVTALAFR